MIFYCLQISKQFSLEMLRERVLSFRLFTCWKWWIYLASCSKLNWMNHEQVLLFFIT